MTVSYELYYTFYFNYITSIILVFIKNINYKQYGFQLSHINSFQYTIWRLLYSIKSIWVLVFRCNTRSLLVLQLPSNLFFVIITCFYLIYIVNCHSYIAVLCGLQWMRLPRLAFSKSRNDKRWETPHNYKLIVRCT